MIGKKIKIFIAFILAVFILVFIAYHLGDKFQQQDRLYIRNKLSNMDARLRELGVNICIIQPKEAKGNRFIVMLDFWESDEKKVMQRLEKIKKIVSNYIKEMGVRSPVTMYLDSKGFHLDDVLKAEVDVDMDESDAEFISVVQKFSSELEKKVREGYTKVIDSTRFRIRLIADAEYDVTLDTYAARKLYFFARFNDATTRELRTVRIMYKKITPFKVARGDKIYFYNQRPSDFQMINDMTVILDREKMAEGRTKTVVFNPLKKKSEYLKPAKKPGFPGFPPFIKPTTPEPSPAPSPKSSPTPTPSVSPSEIPTVSPLPGATPTESPSTTPDPEVTPAPGITVVPENVGNK